MFSDLTANKAFKRKIYSWLFFVPQTFQPTINQPLIWALVGYHIMRVNFGTKKQWIGVGVLILALTAHITYLETREIPVVEFGYPQSQNSKTNEFYDWTNLNRIQIEDKTRAMCSYLNGSVHDFAGYKVENKGWHNKGIMEAIIPETWWGEEWWPWKRRLYKKAPLHFSTENQACVLYKTKGQWLTPSKYPEERVGNIVLSCCWEK